jgi:hypothetical protein
VKRGGIFRVGDIGGEGLLFYCGSGLAGIASRLSRRHYKNWMQADGFGIVWDYSCNPRINSFLYKGLNSGYGKICYKMTTK